MSEDNVYERGGTRSRMSLDFLGGEEDTPSEEWDFEDETYAIPRQHADGHVVFTTGVTAAIERWGMFDACQTCVLSFSRPRVPAESLSPLILHFPPVLEYPNRTLCIIGFENLQVNRATGHRDVRIFVKMAPDYPHFTTIPNNPIILAQTFFLLEDVEVPGWIKEDPVWTMPETP